jgi:hypothetical protein
MAKIPIKSGKIKAIISPNCVRLMRGVQATLDTAAPGLKNWFMGTAVSPPGDMPKNRVLFT